MKETAGRRVKGHPTSNWELRNWYNFFWLSGGYMMDLGLHQVDEIAWIQGDVPPTACVASGGGQIPEYGNIYDHYDATFQYASGVLAVFKIRGWEGCHNDFRLEVFGQRPCAVRSAGRRPPSAARSIGSTRAPRAHAPDRT